MKGIALTVVDIFFWSLLLPASVVHASLIAGGTRGLRSQKQNATVAVSPPAQKGGLLEARKLQLLQEDIADALFPLLYDEFRSLQLIRFETKSRETVQFDGGCSSDAARIKYQVIRFENRAQASLASASSSPAQEIYLIYFDSDGYAVFKGIFLFKATYDENVDVKVKARLRDPRGDCGYSPQSTNGRMVLKGFSEAVGFFAEGRYDVERKDIVGTPTIELHDVTVSHDAISTDIEFDDPVVFDLETEFIELWEEKSGAGGSGDSDATELYELP